MCLKPSHLKYRFPDKQKNELAVIAQNAIVFFMLAMFTLLAAIAIAVGFLAICSATQWILRTTGLVS